MGSSVFVWYLCLFGGLRAVRGQESVTRFRSQKFGALLAYLALFPGRLHAREELADSLWPDAPPETGRANVRAALASLRRQLEPPGSLPGSVLVTQGRTHLCLNPDALTTDVAAFEAALARARVVQLTAEEKAGHLAQAVALYAGPLLPGCYEPWALQERDRLAEAHLQALLQLVHLQQQAGDADQALDYARRALSVDPLREEAHAAVIRLLMHTGQSAAAKRQFAEFARLLREHDGDSRPDPGIKALLDLPVPVPASVSVPVPISAPVPLASVPDATSPVPAPVHSRSPSNLPLAVTRFFGREEEIVALQEHLLSPDSQGDVNAAARLVTLTGPGGSGKTRVALEVAKRLMNVPDFSPEFGGGIWFVPLVDVREAERLPEALAAALGIRLDSDKSSLLPQVLETLQAAAGSGGRVLVVLDNFEQLASSYSAVSVVWSLLSQVSGLALLVTSRQRLRLEGEREFPLLPLPTPGYPGTPPRLLEFSSVQLFVHRAQAARSDFQLTSRNAASVGQLCAALEGMPLALELAAAWMSVLTPSQMLSRLSQTDKRLDLLVSRRRDVSPRHRTLRAAIASSVSLLTPAVQRFLASLSVFRGGWTLAAAEAVCEMGCEAASASALEALTELADHSLIVRMPQETEAEEPEEGDSVIRFRMLETIREFAEEIQNETPEETDRLRERHARWALALAEQAAPFLTGSDQVKWFRRLHADQDNLRGALAYLLDHDVEAELRLAVALFRFWQSRGPITEAHEWLEQGLERDAAGTARIASPSIRAQALECSGTLAWYRSDISGAQARLEESISLYRELGDGVGVARAINSFAGMQNIADNPEGARLLLEAGLAEMTALGGTTGAAGRQILLESLTRDAVIRNDRETIHRFAAEWLTLARGTGDHHLIAAALTWKGFAEINADDFASAVATLTESLAIAREVNEVLYVCSALWGLGYIALFEGNAARAGELQRDAMRTISGAAGYDFSLVHIITALAAAAIADGQAAHAALLLGAGAMLRKRLGYTVAPVLVRVDLQEIIDRARSALGASAFGDAYAAGSALSLDEAIQAALRDSADRC